MSTEFLRKYIDILDEAAKKQKKHVRGKPFVTETLERISRDELDISDEDLAGLAKGPELVAAVIEDIKLMMETAEETGEIPIDDLYYDFGDIFKDVHVNGDDRLVKAYMLVRSANEDDSAQSFIVKCKKALAMLGLV